MVANRKSVPSKHGVVGLTKQFALAFGKVGVRVNAVCPGYIKTEINGEWFDTDAGERQIQKFHRRRLMEEGDLDSILLFLASDASRAVTGTHFTIDDGQSL